MTLNWEPEDGYGWDPGDEYFLTCSHCSATGLCARCRGEFEGSEYDGGDCRECHTGECILCGGSGWDGRLALLERRPELHT